MNVIKISSSGGHFTEISLLNMSKILRMIDIEDKFHLVNITMDRPDTKNLSNTYYMVDTSRNPFRWTVNIIQSLYLYFKIRPSYVITTGAGFAIPFCYISKIFGSKVYFIESFCRVSSKSFSGRLLYSISDKFYVQWKNSLNLWGKKAEYFPLLNMNYKVSLSDFENAKNIFVTVGSSPYQFNRLIKLLDAIASKYPDKNFFYQIGSSSYIPKNGEYTRYLSNNDYITKIKSSDFIISHAGAGSIMNILLNRKPFYLMSRLSENHEAANNHQEELHTYFNNYLDINLIKLFTSD